MDIGIDLQELEVDSNSLKPKYKSLEGTREIIQYENKDYVFTLSKTWKPKIKCYGITNRCNDGKYILFLDYDKVYTRTMLKDLDNLMEDFPKRLDNFYIAQTEPEQDGKGSYHVVNFAKNPKSIVDHMVNCCSVDPYFKEIPHKTAHKCHVLRFSEKIWKVNGKILKESPSFYTIYPNYPIISGRWCSSPHYKLFQATWKFPNPALPHFFDEEDQIELHSYSTPKVEKCQAEA